MKKLFFLLVVFLTLHAHAQLQSGVYTRLPLTHWYDYEQAAPTCISYELDFYNNLFPGVTGMDYYLKVDSIPGGPNSVRLYHASSYVFINTGDSFLVTFSASTFYFYFYASTTVYLSFEMVGTPQVSGQPYYCFYSMSNSMLVDNCQSPTTWQELNGGAGPGDTLKGCSVDGPLGISSHNHETTLDIYPNPSHGTVQLQEAGTLSVFDARGMLVRKIMVTNEEAVALNDLESGIYFLQLETASGVKRKMLELVKN